MNVVFQNKLSQDAFSNVITRPENEAVRDWFLRFQNGAWSVGAKVDDFEWDDSGCVIATKSGGRIARLSIYAATSACYLTADKVREYTESSYRLVVTGPYASEFSWRVEYAECDNLGYAPPEYPDVSGGWKMYMSGGLVNHGTHEAPDWASHT